MTSRTLLTALEGFTPLPDILVEQVGITTAAVWGRMWRYCQMDGGVCQASLETLARELGLHRTTIIQHVDVLVKGGYFIDKTPDLKNRPHTYVDSGLLSVQSKIAVVKSNTPAVEESEIPTAQSDFPTATVVNSDLKIDSKIESKIVGAGHESSELPVDWQVALMAGKITQRLPSIRDEAEFMADQYFRGAEDLKPYAIDFMVTTGRVLTKAEAPLWRKALREQVVSVGYTLQEFHDATVEHMDKMGRDHRPLSIKSPASVTYGLRHETNVVQEWVAA